MPQALLETVLHLAERNAPSEDEDGGDDHVIVVAIDSQPGMIGRTQPALIAWLASADCSFTTGAVFDISGGRATY